MQGPKAHLWAAITEDRDNGLARSKHVEAVHQVLYVAAPTHHHNLLGLGVGLGYAVPDAAVPLLQDVPILIGHSM